MYTYDASTPLSRRICAGITRHYAGRGKDDLIPGTFTPKANRTNDYMIDRKLQKSGSFTGIPGVNTQDFALQEGMGAIVDRSKEFLGTTDKAIVSMRRLLLEATRDVEAGRKPRGIDPATLSQCARPRQGGRCVRRLAKRSSPTKAQRAGKARLTIMAMDENLARLRALDICDLSDALDALGLPPAVTGLIQASAGKPIAGRAVTVKLIAGNAPGGSTRHLCTHAVEAAGPDNIIVIEQRSGIDAAAWGGILSRAAQVRGIAGTVIDGPARDIEESDRHRLYCLCAHAHLPYGARAHSRKRKRYADCLWRPTTVHPGDYIAIDRSGCVVDSCSTHCRRAGRAETNPRQERRHGRRRLSRLAGVESHGRRLRENAGKVMCRCLFYDSERFLKRRLRR